MTGDTIYIATATTSSAEPFGYQLRSRKSCVVGVISLTELYSPMSAFRPPAFGSSNSDCSPAIGKVLVGSIGQQNFR